MREVEERKVEEIGEKGITLVPIGGVASRLRTIASMIHLAQRYQRPLEVIWRMDEEMPVPTDRLFTLAPRMAGLQIEMRAFKWSDMLRMPPTLGNLFFTAPIVALSYDRVIPPKRVERLLTKERSALEKIIKDHKKSLLIATDESFGNYPGMYDAVETTVEVNNVLLSSMASWSGKVVGIHINRRVNPQSTYNEAPIELFIKRMQESIETDRETNFFIATTSKDEQERLATIFKDRVFVPHSVADPMTVKGVIQSLGELLALSHCDRILTTPGSNYSQVASELGGVPLEVLSIYTNN